MELQEAIRTRRSIRQFTDTPVPNDLLEQVVALAAWAPSELLTKYPLKICIG